jgi:hypothetical protein
MDIPQIIFEEGIEFGDEETYNKFITYCEWYLFDGNIDELDNELCLNFRILCISMCCMMGYSPDDFIKFIKDKSKELGKSCDEIVAKFVNI